jgi:nucleoside-diphosphate-sugar epimerase
MAVISIVGAGWLGLPLAQYLAKDNSVYASKTTEAGLTSLDSSTITGFVADLSASNSIFEEQLQQQNPQTVFGCFPPGFRSGSTDQYISHWQRLVAACLKANVEKLIMISTTGVYPERPDIMAENDASFRLSSESSFSEKNRILLQAEQVVIDSGINYVIIRCGGLFGPNRHPARFASRLKAISQSAPANMLHLHDAIDICAFAHSQLDRCVINAVSPNRPNKMDFYRAALAQVGKASELPPIIDKPDKGVSAEKLLSLGYRFHYLSPIEGLEHCELTS